ncbi:uncharacterized protein Spf45 isoform X1 [Halyomorpha halys]|uniref:uncharacterized protein Spf45 isoform X1 n=1 Tax=Halyomorpha halys TaxID=286706 RepID=UPI0006D4F0BA|nr:uncharacterized protein LOC106678337 isoform X1 [Halyomorpha halys]
MSSKKKFGSTDELNRLDSSKISCFSQCLPPLPPKPRRLNNELLPKKPSSFRSSQLLASNSPYLSPICQTEPISVYLQDQNDTARGEKPLATSTPKKAFPKDRSKENKAGRSDLNTDQPTKSSETRSRKPSSQSKTSSDQGQSDLSSIKEETKDEYDHELYHTSPRVFKPRLYNFRNPLHLTNLEENSFKVIAPPFWVLVDHIIAVVWFLYTGDKKKKVEIYHLEWALEFARWLRDEKGDHSKTVKTLIGIFEDAINDKKIKSKEKDDEPSDNSEDDEDTPAAHPKEDEMTSVTLQDILLRTSGLPLDKTCASYPVCAAAAPSTSPPKPENFSSNVEDDEDQERLLDFLQQMRDSQNDKVNKESSKLKELDEAIEALKEGKLKFGEWLKEHYK